VSADNHKQKWRCTS